jgi:hypothetical protein
MIFQFTTPKVKRSFTVTCAHCGKQFQAESDRARWCSQACKQAAYRKRRDRVTVHTQ